MDEFQMNKEVVKFLSLSFCLTQIFVCCSSTRVHGDVKFGDVSCNYSGISLDIFSENNFEGIIYPQGHFFNPSCSYYASVIQNISIFLPLTDCGTLVRELHGTLYISNVVVVQKHRFVETASDVVHNVSCKLPYPETLDTEEVWTHGNHSSRYKNNALESWMDFLSGSDNLGKDVANKLLVGDEFLMVIHLKDGGINKALQVESCWAYDGETIKESQYTLNIYDRYKCESSDWISEFNLTKGMKNVSDSMTYAVIKAFKFPMTKNVHITCSVQICTNSCWDYCKMPQAQRSNAYPRIFKRSTPDFPDKSLRERYKLMKATVKALGAKLIENNRAHRSENNSGFRRRVSNSEITTTPGYEVVIASEEYDYYDKEYTEASKNSQLGIPKDSSNSFGAESENYTNDVYVFNLTNSIVVFTGHEFNSRYEYVAPIELPANCVSKLRFGMVMASLCFISFCLLIACIGLTLYLRKERKRHKINNFLLYNFY